VGKPRRLPWHALLDALFAEGAATAAVHDAMNRAHPEVRRTQIDGRLKWLRGNLPKAGASVPNSGTSDVVASPLASAPITLDALLALFGIDPAEWEAVEVTPNVWHVGSAHPETGEILTSPLYQLKARLKRKAPPVLAGLRDALLADIRAEAQAGPKPARVTVEPERRHMLEVSAFDLHFGKLAWREEAGEDYDLSLAREAFERAVEDLVWKARGFPLQRILLPIGNDLLQTDNLAGTTTGGTPQDTDSRYVKAFRAARSALAWAIDRLATEAPVLVIVVPGNHDRLTSFHMGEVLAAQFAADPRVTVDNSPKLRKYVAFGVNLLGFTHGSEEKHADLPLIMAREEPELWSAAQHYEWHIGHLHKSKETRYTAGDSFNGVRVRILPSLCAADAWHYSKGYVGERRSAEGYLWNFATGYAGHLATSILPSRAA
jgi:hypothetical protein